MEAVSFISVSLASGTGPGAGSVLSKNCWLNEYKRDGQRRHLNKAFFPVNHPPRQESSFAVTTSR